MSIPEALPLSRVTHGAALVLSLGLFLVTPAVGQLTGLDADPFAVHLLGKWSGSGVYDGNRLELTRSWTLGLGGQFLRADMGVSMPNGSSFGALMYWRRSAPGRYEVTWMDAMGRMQSLEARVHTESGVVATTFMDELAEDGPERRRWEYERTGADAYVERLFRLLDGRTELLAEWTFTRGLERSPVVASERAPDEAAVLAAVQGFFDTMNSRDLAGATEVLDPRGDFVSVRWAPDGERIVRRASIEDYLAGLEAGTESFLERMWDPEVRIQGPIAAVWAPYDFHVDGEFSHCGVDAFQLLRTDAGWVITGGTYTVERAGCGESPLGPPNGSGPTP